MSREPASLSDFSFEFLLQSSIMLSVPPVEGGIKTESGKLYCRMTKIIGFSHHASPILTH
jgi:hypothetical protein